MKDFVTTDDGILLKGNRITIPLKHKGDILNQLYNHNVYTDQTLTKPLKILLDMSQYITHFNSLLLEPMKKKPAKLNSISLPEKIRNVKIMLVNHKL